MIGARFVGVVSGVLCGTVCLSGVAKAQSASEWPHTTGYVAELLSEIAILGPPPGGGGPTVHENDFVQVHGFAPQAVFGGTQVTFGPFLAKTFPDSTGTFSPTGPRTWTVSVLARTPLSRNPSATFSEIGHAQVTVQGNSATSFSIAATLPAALSAVEFQFSVSRAGDSTAPAQQDFSVSTDVSTDCINGVSDDGCLQAAINPLGMIASLAPVTLLYEPPGGCSFASFTANSVQGTNISIDLASATNNGTLTTIPIPEDGTTMINNESSTHTADNTKTNQIQMTTGVTVFTQQGGMSAPTGCQTRTTGGPGHGDTFEILDNAPFVYWDTNNLSNSRLRIATSDPSTTEPFIPGQSPGQIVITADQLQQLPSAQLPGTLAVRSRADLNAILGLDPLVTLASSTSSGAATTVPFVPLPLPRYAPLMLKPEVTIGDAYQIMQTLTDTQADAASIKLVLDSVGSQMSGQSALTKFEIDAATQIPTSAFTAAANASGVGAAFSWVPKVLTDYLTSLLTSDTTVKTTVENTLTSTSALSLISGGGSVQNVFLRDFTRTMNVQLYWDQIFGTIAYQEVPAAMGTLALTVQTAAASIMKPLADVAWIKTVVSGQDSSTAFPQTISEQLSAVAGGGSFTLVPVSASDFQTHAGFLAGLPTGVTVGVSGLAGTTTAAPGVYQQAFFIVDASGNRDGVFWQTTAVAASTASENGMCSAEPNSVIPGTEIVTCCSLAGLCDSFVAPTTGLTIHLEAESNSGQSQITASATAVAANADDAYIKFSAVDFGPIASLINGFRARALPSAAGQSLELWVDSPGSSGGGTLLGTLPFDGPIQNCAGSWADAHQTRGTTLSDAPSGAHDVYVVFRGPPGNSLDWIELSFEAQSPMGPRVQYRPGDVGQPNDNQIQPWITIANDGNTDMKLNNLLVRYWYTIDSGAPQTLNVDYASFGSQNVSGTFVGLAVPLQEADQSLNVSFPAATCFVPPGSSSGEIHLRVNKTNWSNYNETNDYSYVAGRISFADNMAVTAYVGGKLVWGMEPAAVPGAETASSGLNFHVQYKVGDPGQPTDNAIKSQVVIFNDNTVSIPLGQLTLRYWFTAETNVGSQFWCDYALVGNSNVSGSIVDLGSPVPGANRYVQVSFSPGAGSLFPLGSSGEIQTRVSQVDWSNYNEFDDYSYNASDTSFANWSHVTLYRNGTLVWGTEP